MMKKLIVATAAIASVGFSAVAISETVPSPIGDFDVSMTATLASDYIWRGQSQTNGTGAIQGSLDVSHESGLYVGAWESSIDDETFAGSDTEINYLRGLRGNFTDVLAYDLSWNTYIPTSNGLNVDEWIGNLAHTASPLGPSMPTTQAVLCTRSPVTSMSCLMSYS